MVYIIVTSTQKHAVLQTEVKDQHVIYTWTKHTQTKQHEYNEHNTQVVTIIIIERIISSAGVPHNEHITHKD